MIREPCPSHEEVGEETMDNVQGRYVKRYTQSSAEIMGDGIDGYIE